MSKKTKTPIFTTGEFISEDAVRGAFGRRRRAATAGETGAEGRSPAVEETTPAARPGAPLRRWSVAELIAKAITPATAEGAGN